MMKKMIFGWVWLCMILLALPAFAGAPEEEPGWELKKETDGIKIFNREKQGSPIKELLAITTLDVPVQKLAAVVGDYDHFKDFMPYTVISKNLKKEKVGPKKDLNYFYTGLDLPMVSNRYYTLELTDEWDPDGKEGWFRSQWTLSTKPGLNPDLNDPAVKDLAPKGFKDAIKTPINDGFWLFEPLPDDAGAKVTYYVYTDPGGSIPSWVANQANSIAVPKLMKAVRQRAKNN